ncbi:MAG: hypothetical protein ACJ8AS_09040 [Hyphomicrobiales bacterium]
MDIVVEMLRYLALLVIVLALPAAATELPGRYVLEKAPTGYLRIDSETGAIASCRAEAGVWVCADLAGNCCRPGPDCGRAERNDNVAKAFKIFAVWLDRFVLFARSIAG